MRNASASNISSKEAFPLSSSNVPKEKEESDALLVAYLPKLKLWLGQRYNIKLPNSSRIVEL